MLLEKIHGRLVERRAERQHAQLPGPIEDRLVPFPGRLRLGIQIVKRPPRPQTLRVADVEFAPVEIDGYRTDRKFNPKLLPK